MQRFILGLTGASGGVYFLRLADFLSRRELELHLIASEQGEKVLAYETGMTLDARMPVWEQGGARIVREDNRNLFSAVASGSFRCDGMAVAPCSMATVARIASGASDTLLTRAADVMIKEKRTLVLVPRETPLSPIHLKNLYELSRLGVTILPAMPGFYHRPQSLHDLVDFMAGKILDSLGIENDCFERWKGKEEP